jgi:hypothetical protein
MRLMGESIKLMEPSTDPTLSYAGGRYSPGCSSTERRFNPKQGEVEGKVFPYAPVGCSALLVLLPSCMQE